MLNEIKPTVDESGYLPVMPVGLEPSIFRAANVHTDVGCLFFPLCII